MFVWIVCALLGVLVVGFFLACFYGYFVEQIDEKEQQIAEQKEEVKRYKKLLYSQQNYRHNYRQQIAKQEQEIAELKKQLSQSVLPPNA